MKLFGSNQSSKHSGGTSRSKGSAQKRNDPQDRPVRQYPQQEIKPVPMQRPVEQSKLSSSKTDFERGYSVEQAKAYERKMAERQAACQPVKKAVAKKKRTARMVLIIVLAVLLALAAGAFIWWKVAVKPPEISKSKGTKTVKIFNHPDGEKIEDEPIVEEDEPEEPDERSGQKYTFLVLGCDDGNGNTDTIMAVTFDTNAYTLNVVSIPRDTLVNVKWSTKKVNTLYYAYKEDGVKTAFADLLGYEVDFYCIVDLEAFIVLIDDIGGVDYDVPVNMNYDDPYQDLHIHLTKGMQHLNGKQAMGVVRYRKGYANADIGRIGTQQDFLMTVAKQLIANKDKLSISALADVFVNYVKTDLTTGNIVWLAKEFFKMNTDNIQFFTIPANTNDSVGGQSYVTIYVNKWLEMINTYFNPFDSDVEISDLDILTRNSSGALYATSGVRKGDPSWGSGGKSSSSQEGTTTDTPEGETPTDETDPEFDPSAVIGAETTDPNTGNPNGEVTGGDIVGEDPNAGGQEIVIIGGEENTEDYIGV